MNFYETAYIMFPLIKILFKSTHSFEIPLKTMGEISELLLRNEVEMWAKSLK